MKKRDPLRFRKSEVGQKRFHQRGGSAVEGLPRPTTDRQLAFVILDEHIRTKTFVGQLLDEKLEGLGRSFPGRKPLGGRVGSPDSAGQDAPPESTPWKKSPKTTVRNLSKYDRPFISEMVNGVVRRQATLDALLGAFVTRPRYSIEDQLWTLLQLGLYQLVFMHGVPPHAAVHETVELGRWAQQPRWCGFMNGVFRSIAREISETFEETPSSSRVPVSVRPALLVARAAASATTIAASATTTAPEPTVAPEPPSPEPELPATITPAPANSPWPTAKSTEPVPPPLSAPVAASVPVPESAPPAKKATTPRDTPESRLTEIRYREIGKDVFPPPETDLPGYITAAFGLPDWLIARWGARFTPDELLQMAKWFDLRQPLTLRVNLLKTTRDELLAEIQEAVRAEPSTLVQPGDRPESIRYDGPFRIVDLPGFSDGRFTVQDETAMSAAALLAPQPGERVLDLCAAPGTKTTHLAELMQGEGSIVATDVELGRLRRIEENADRLGFSMIEPLVIREDLTELPAGPFDAILIDVPCSNTGVLGKRPEVRSRITPEDIEELAATQKRLLSAAATLVAPGGRIVYSTCSVEPEENSGVVSQFLEKSTDFELLETQEFLPGKPADGGYQVLLRRKL